MPLAQTIFYVVSPLVTLLAVLVAYLALLKQSRPQILIHYRPNPDIQSIIDLVVENIGSGLALDVVFSKPIPIKCFGIEKPDGSGKSLSESGFPAISAGQRFVFDGGQFGGLKDQVKEGLEVEISYYYKNPIGIRRNKTDVCILSIAHLSNMPTRTSAGQAVVDALKGPNRTTLQKIHEELAKIRAALED